MTKTTRYISKRQEWESKQSKLNTSSLDYMGQKTSETITFFDRDIKGNIIERPKQITVYKHSNYSNVYVETNSKNSQNISKYLNKKINIDKEYGLLDKIVILKNKTLEGYAAYNNNINVFYISEELINHEEFKKMIDFDYFPARNIDDVLTHELKGHKAHWDAIKRYQTTNNLTDINVAKERLESNIRQYINNQLLTDPFYIAKFISDNADTGYANKLLNELIADGILLIEKGNLEDNQLRKFIKEVLGYDS